MKSFGILVAVMCCSATLWAQGKFEFTKSQHDFGDIREGVMAEHVFTFRNIGNQPIIITNVSASCGCTTPNWSKDPVMPGETGSVTAVYNSQGRPGAFFKTITVTSNADESQKVLQIKGNVIGNPQPTEGQVVVADPNIPLPSLVIEGREYSFGKMQAGDKVTHSFNIKNTGKQDMVIKSVYSECNCVTYKVTPSAIGPGQSGKLEVTFAPKAASKKPETVFVVINAPTKPEYNFTLKGEVVQSMINKSPVQEGPRSAPFK